MSPCTYFHGFFFSGKDKPESAAAPFPKKSRVQQMIDDIVVGIVGEVVQQRWLCPICGCFDSVCGTSNKNNVWRHILGHAKYIIDVRIKPSKNSKRLSCLECSSVFEDPDYFIHHMAFSHNKLTEKTKQLKLASDDYKPLAYVLPVQKKRLKWQCLQCNQMFAKEYALMLHIAHFHYFELLVPMHTKRSEFIEKKYYTCTQKNCVETFQTSKALLTHEQLCHDALQVYMGKMIGQNTLYKKIE